MRQTIVALIVALFATTVNAESFVVTGKVVDIQPIYTKVRQNKPQKVCRTEEVPVYGNVQGGGDAAGGALAGMIIGGILGKGISGNDDGAAAGAVIGGLIGADKGANGTKRVITGYKQQRTCSTEYVSVDSHVINEYNIVYNVNGFQVTQRVNSAQGQRAYVGQSKRFRVRYQPIN